MALRRLNTRSKVLPPPHRGLGLMVLAAAPLIVWLVSGDFLRTVTALGALGLLAGALRLISDGCRVHRLYDAAQIARRPRLPRKVLGAVLIGLTAGLLGFAQGGILLALPIAALAGGLAVYAFGIDPLEDKGFDNPVIVQRLANQAMLDAFEDLLAQASTRVVSLGDADLALRTNGACAMAQRFIRATSQSGATLSKLQRPLKTFTDILDREISGLEADWRSERHKFARRSFLAKLEVLTQSFEGRVRSGRLMEGEDLVDIDADILSERMDHSSIPAETRTPKTEPFEIAEAKAA